MIGALLASVAALALLAAPAHAWQIRKAASSYISPDSVVSGAGHWWGLRAWSAANIGQPIINIRRASDSTTTDIVALADGSLDVATAGTFCAATTCFAVTVYDQVTNTDCTGSLPCHITQATTSRQPALVFNCIGTLPCLRGTNAASTCLGSAADGTAHAQPLTYSTVVAPTWASNRSVMVNTSAVDAGNPTLRTSTVANNLRISAGVAFTQAYTSAAWTSWQALFNGVSSISRQNGAETAASNAGANGTGGGGWSIFANNACAAASDMDWTESGMWGSGFDATERANMETNQRNYWGF